MSENKTNVPVRDLTVKEKFNLKKLITEPLKVTKTMKVDELIKTMRTEKKHPQCHLCHHHKLEFLNIAYP